MSDLSKAETAIIHLFAERLGVGGNESPLVRCSEIFSLPAFSRHEIASAMNDLIERGWFFRGGDFHKKDGDVCLLLSEGFRMAQLIAAKRPKQSPKQR